MIPIRGGETATLQVPLGRYRISYAPNASWQGEFKLQGEAREGVDGAPAVVHGLKIPVQS